jgi:hypothetical protein
VDTANRGRAYISLSRRGALGHPGPEGHADGGIAEPYQAGYEAGCHAFNVVACPYRHASSVICSDEQLHWLPDALLSLMHSSHTLSSSLQLAGVALDRLWHCATMVLCEMGCPVLRSMNVQPFE